jgi:hypothetical protein
MKIENLRVRVRKVDYPGWKKLLYTFTIPIWMKIDIVVGGKNLSQNRLMVASVAKIAHSSS